VRRKISADVDGGLSGVSRCADTGAEILVLYINLCCVFMRHSNFALFIFISI
jgi:hypothetical protein